MRRFRDLLTTLELLLIIITLLALATSWISYKLLVYMLPAASAVIALLALSAEGFNSNMIGVFLIDVVLVILAIRRIRGKDHITSWTKTKKILAVTGIALGLVLLYGSFASALEDNPPLDLTGMTWSNAFKAMHETFSREYAFGDWKQVQWDELYAEYAPLVAEAESDGDKQAYYADLLSYASSIPDGHVWLEGNGFGAWEVNVGGGYGLTLLMLENGRVIAVKVTLGGPADQAGIVWGDEVTAWNGVPVGEALQSIKPIWPARRGAPATLEGLLNAELRLLVRSPPGTEATIEFRNIDNESIIVTMSAVHDGLMDSDGNSGNMLPPVEDPVILPSGYGYLKINSEDDSEGIDVPASLVAEAVKLFNEEKVPGVIMDVRGNRGGSDELVTRYVAYFTDENRFYEQTTAYFQPLNTFIPRETLEVKQAQPHYSGPLIILIDNACFSSGEGIPLILSGRVNTTIIGFHGTYGSFGMTGGLIHLPEGLTLHYPDGQSLDAKGVIQLDSDYTLQGGVQPTIKVPLTLEAAKAVYIEHRDYLLEYAVNYLNSKQ